MYTFPVSAVVPTKNRVQSLSKTLNSLLAQNIFPKECIVVDASEDDATKRFLFEFEERVNPAASVRWMAAEIPGAAAQRNQGVAAATQPFIWFFDDDILFEPDSVRRLWSVIDSDPQLGGVNAMIVNQRYQPPRLISRAMFTVMHGRTEKSFAGRVIGPAINLLPEDRDDLPEIVPVEWLNTTCTIYRREALPSPPFDSFFTDYSMMEDLALSLRVGKKWQLANVHTARIVHDSQSNQDKDQLSTFHAMELVNRYYVMLNVMGRRRFSDLAKFALWETFITISTLTSLSGLRSFPRIVAEKVRALGMLNKLPPHE